MSSKPYKVVLAGFEELDDIDVFGATAARDELISLVLERDRWFPESLGEASGDESDNPVLDLGRVIEEDRTVAVDDLHRVIGEVFGGEFSLRIERFELAEDLVHTIFSREERMQEKAGYDGLLENRIQHGLLLNTLSEHILKYAEGKLGTPAEANSTLSSFMTHWFIDHILKTDLKMRGKIKG